MQDERMWPPSDDELRRVLRYVFGECSREEAKSVERWLATNPSRRMLLRDLTQLRDAAPEAPGVGRYDVARARHALERRRRDAAAPARSSPGITLHQSGAHRRSPLLTAAIAASVVGILVAGATLEMMRSRHSGREYATALGERLTVKLEDGTLIMLAPQSTLRIPEMHGRAAREASLKGEAFFRVVHDSMRPFRVLANGVTVADVGTVFDVRAYASDSLVQVAVEDGRVAVQARHNGGQPVTPLGAGDVATVSAAGSIARSHSTDVARYLAWTRGTLTFHAAPLRAVLVELDRWYGVEVTVADSAMLSRLVTANWSSEASSDALADLAAMLHARPVHQGHTVTLVPIAPDTAPTPER